MPASNPDLFDMTFRDRNNVTSYADTAFHILGRGIRYPFAFGGSFKNTGRLEESFATDKINGSIAAILGTIPGERMYQPDFGSMLQYLVFEPNDDILKDKLTLYIKDALDKWEKRIEIIAISFDDSPYNKNNHILNIMINYLIINTQVTGNYVYPFIRDPRPVNPDLNLTF